MIIRGLERAVIKLLPGLCPNIHMHQHQVNKSCVLWNGNSFVPHIWFLWFKFQVNETNYSQSNYRKCVDSKVKTCTKAILIFHSKNHFFFPSSCCLVSYHLNVRQKNEFIYFIMFNKPHNMHVAFIFFTKIWLVEFK